VEGNPRQPREDASERQEANMDGTRFDGLVKALTSESRSRRGVLRGLAEGIPAEWVQNVETL